jgi:hypothetical protein
MRYLALIFLISSALFAEMPNLSGVWKADLGKSKLAGGPAPTKYLISVDLKTDVVDRRTKQQAPEFIETSAITGEHGETRLTLTAFDYEKPIDRYPYDGIPTRITGRSSPNTFTIVGEVAGTKDHFKRTYTLSPDGQTLTVAIEGMGGGHPLDATIVFNKGTDADGEALRKPEEVASVHFKNVKEDALKNLPVSEFISQMRYFAWSLGKQCTFCHVERKFDSDDKKEKKSARKMVEMVAAIDENHFEGHPAVRCFTCHEGNGHPPSRPLFADEIAASAAQKEHDEQNRPAPPPPGGPGGPPPPPHN